MHHINKWCYLFWCLLFYRYLQPFTKWLSVTFFWAANIASVDQSAILPCLRLCNVFPRSRLTTFQTNSAPKRCSPLQHSVLTSFALTTCCWFTSESDCQGTVDNTVISCTTAKGLCEIIGSRYALYSSCCTSVGYSSFLHGLRLLRQHPVSRAVRLLRLHSLFAWRWTTSRLHLLSHPRFASTSPCDILFPDCKYSF